MNLMLQEKETSYLYDTPLLHQSSFWSQVKQNQGYQTKAFDIKVRSSDISELGGSSYLLDDVLVLLSPINRDQTIGYVPYGPVLKPLQDKMGPFLEDLSIQLQEKLPPSCILLRYDLPWQRVWEEDDLSRELQELRLNWGTNYHQIRKSCSDQLPSNTMFVDLRGGEDELLERMHHKTRYNIRLAHRKGVEVQEVTREGLPIFYALYQETCQRNNIHLHDLSFFESLFISELDKPYFSLLVASLDGVPLSSMFLTRSGDRATYLYGASSSSNRNSMSTYALQWKAIELARSWGCTSYDLFGVSPTEEKDHPMSNLTTFKKGFGGSFFHRMGCWDYWYDQDEGKKLYAFEMMDKGYHLR
ncbi:lipid II:glycine glycyltransferase FemX [Sphaerochaeta sp. PS]|uniref:lipid II:glycine glycyltransferase FemX n=1 Tax=Sphaerochaeta sp. PS TaxID=3076336 RepID=UPI0028A56127|nr:peptidoglycan bridge formation glycyltransferase FemA/FemB family protein [Sphaerochaeta sp. PS]MDT4762752.1 peptidoglycan bridge formation glycyltransferase FemA/FemB family protein [Sphaerochaeta sp. PS]